MKRKEKKRKEKKRKDEDMMIIIMKNMALAMMIRLD